MAEQSEQRQQLAFEPERLGKMTFVGDVLRGVGIMLGLALLWLLESIRNVFFRLLDRLKIGPRARRASAFPPGRPRKHSAAG